MKRFKLPTFAVLFAIGFVSHGASPLATQDWVRRYVALSDGSNGVYEVSAGTNVFRMAYEPYDTYALGVTNSVHATITNGAYFAYLDQGVYTNAQLATFIRSTATNMVWNGIASHTNALGQTMFGETFGVVGTYITASKAKALKGE